jgi:ATP-dependent exoDNAse (exonuclease V) beta subunit
LEFYRQAPEPDLARVLDECVALARAELGRDILRQGRALGRLARDYRRAFEEHQALRGGYRFGDITHLLREARVMGRSDELYFRMDARIRLLLLDEFQDPSLPQWEVLAPVVEEILAGGEEERATVLVADPKQSIYGWRGARPELVDRVRDRFGLADEKLSMSWRSGPVILEAVQRVFQGLEENPVLAAVEKGPEVARRWMKDFYDLSASDPGKPGFAQVIAAPPAEARGAVRPAVLDFSAELVRGLHVRERRASIGVLVRTNRVVRYLIAALKRLDVTVSGEGGTPLTDTAPVNAVLALLRMADHPGDRLARYHVAKTPVGEVVDYRNPDAGAEARRLARRIRGRLLREGYGVTLDTWARELSPACDGIQWARLLQLVELGFRWDRGRTLRTGDFVRFVEAQRVDDPSGAGVRVMTVHQSKGLEFDVVVLPTLYDSLEGGGDRGAAVPVRDPGSGRVLGIYPSTTRSVRALFPELRRAHEENRTMRLRDEMSALYVAMTRARYALHMVVPGDGERGQGTARSPARILRAALAPEVPADPPGRVLWSHGDEAWFRRVASEDLEGRKVRDEEKGTADARAIPAVSLRPVTGARTRNLARLSPSSMEGGDRVDLASLLRMDLSGAARLRGTIVHAWCEEISWLDEGLPGQDLLLELAREGAPGLEISEIRKWLADFEAWLSAPQIVQALRRSAYPPGARVEREVPFLHRVQDGVLHGLIDRLVVWEEEGRVSGAQVLDFKTDLLDGSDPDAVAARAEFYRPQIDAYRQAVAGRYRLDLPSVSGKLLFLRIGAVRAV